MPRRNRVTPLGELIAHPARGLVFGNRGCLHDRHAQIKRTHNGRRWIACRLRLEDRRRELMRPGRYTELFFLDDATALAAGHRPCAECRREDYEGLVECWPGALTGRSRADALDEQLHAERLTGTGDQRRYEADLDELPDGAFVLRAAEPWLVLAGNRRRWTPAGYTDAVPRPVGTRTVLVTPPSIVTVLRRGRRPAAVPFLHPSAEPTRNRSAASA